jgi:hypothetical protein
MLLLVAMLGVVSLVGTILIVPTYQHYSCPRMTICEGGPFINPAKVTWGLLEALVIVVSSSAAVIMSWPE